MDGKRRQLTLLEHVPEHPARFSEELIPHLAEAVQDSPLVLDPFAGVGGIHRVAAAAGVRAVGVELQPKWARSHPRTLVGNALALPFRSGTFHAVCTSPCYGNRMSDHHQACDGSRRHTYTHAYGEALHPDNAGTLPWGPDYRKFHTKAWSEAVRVLNPGGRFVLNVKDFIQRGHVVTEAREWHIETLAGLGLTLDTVEEVRCPGNRHGANGTARVDVEHVYTFTHPTDFHPTGTYCTEGNKR